MGDRGGQSYPGLALKIKISMAGRMNSCSFGIAAYKENTSFSIKVSWRSGSPFENSHYWERKRRDSRSEFGHCYCRIHRPLRPGVLFHIQANRLDLLRGKAENILQSILEHCLPD